MRSRLNHFTGGAGTNAFYALIVSCGSAALAFSRACGDSVFFFQRSFKRRNGSSKYHRDNLENTNPAVVERITASSAAMDHATSGEICFRA